MTARYPFPSIPFVPHPDGSFTLTDRDSPTMFRFSREEFAAFVDGARRGEFDHLLGEPVRQRGACR